jgi:ADP-heptose:LPS heptosyltransferase
MMSNYPEIFKYNDDATYVTPVGSQYYGNSRIERFQRFAKIWRRSFRRLEEYAKFDFSRDQSVPPSRHIIAELCANAGIAGPVSVKPNLLLSSAEKEFGAWASGRIVIQSSGLGARYPMLNKQWYPERFQAVVDSLCDEFDFVQLGSEGDPLLSHVRDLRGATSIRESASILFHAHLYIGGVGFLMHLARAVDCPSVIIFGGREAPWQSGYACNVNLYTSVHCAPCWRWNTCEFDRKCMREITTDDVVRGVRAILSRPRGALTVETVHI